MNSDGTYDTVQHQTGEVAHSYGQEIKAPVLDSVPLGITVKPVLPAR